MMSPVQAAEIIGCSPQQVRWLARNGKIRAKKLPVDSNQYGYVWEIPRREAERVRETRKRGGRGRPRGSTSRGRA